MRLCGGAQEHCLLELVLSLCKKQIHVLRPVREAMLRLVRTGSILVAPVFLAAAVAVLHLMATDTTAGDLIVAAVSNAVTDAISVTNLCMLSLLLPYTLLFNGGH